MHAPKRRVGSLIEIAGDLDRKRDKPTSKRSVIYAPPRARQRIGRNNFAVREHFNSRLVEASIYGDEA
jgi:hypothetical protein